MNASSTHPHGRHFKHCYVYEGSFCSCGGDYRGDEAGPKLDLPPRPFNMMYRVYGTTKSSPAEVDWVLLLSTPDPVEATALAHESEGTLWRRLTEDGQITLARV